MKILIIQEKSRHPKNIEFRESFSLQRALARKGIDVHVWGLGHSNYSTPFSEIVKGCNVILLLENYDQTGWVPDLSKCKALKLFWSIDSHCSLQQHIHTCDVNKINIVLNSIAADVSKFQNINRKAISFPNAYPRDIIYPLNIEKNIDVGFCGNIVNREPVLKYLGITADVMKIGQDMVRYINSYKIHWNKNIAHDINYRTFETLGCQTFLITNNTDILEGMFEIDKHLVTYDNVHDCKEKIEYYLKHEKERIDIEKAGFEHVINNHSYDNRAELLIEIIEEII